MTQPRITKRISGTRGFTIVELLIVIVVIAILAAISVVAYQGIQERARDSQRLQDVKTIAKALEMYYLDNGRFPKSDCFSSGCPSTKQINGAWATTADGTWSVLEAALVPKYLSSLPKDPSAKEGATPAIYGGLSYDYVITASWCGALGSHYLLSYRLESQPQQRNVVGTCSSTPSTPDYQGSEHVVIK